MGGSASVHVWPDPDGGYGAERLDLPGCVSQGETVGEALANLADAVHEVLASLTDDDPRRR